MEQSIEGQGIKTDRRQVKIPPPPNQRCTMGRTRCIFCLLRITWVELQLLQKCTFTNIVLRYIFNVSYTEWQSPGVL